MKCGESDERNVVYRESYTPEKFFHLLIPQPAPIIIDVGAHFGESATYLSSLFPNARIFSIEPDPESFAKLTQSLPEAARAFNLAIGARSGSATFYQYDKSHLNSLYAINKDSVDSLGYAHKSSATSIDVRCATLDDFVAEAGIAGERVSLLKIDAQGAEVDVLTGAQSMIHNVDNVTVELTLYDFYGKKNKFLDVERLLPGFELYAITKLSQNPKNFRTDWAEVFYTRANRPIR